MGKQTCLSKSTFPICIKTFFFTGRNRELVAFNCAGYIVMTDVLLVATVLKTKGAYFLNVSSSMTWLCQPALSQ